MKRLILTMLLLSLFGCATPEEKAEFAALEDCRESYVELEKTIKCSGSCDKQPIKRIHPTYPKNALTDAKEGCAVVVYDVRKDGLADNFRIMKLSPADKGFEDSVLDALMKSEYEKSESKNRLLKVQFLMRR